MRYRILLLCALGATLAARADGLRDPMRPPQAEVRGAVAREPAPVLSAVLTFNGVRSAIFNGRLVRDGAAVDGYTIETVLEDGVRIRRAGLVQELHLPHLTSFKKPAAEPVHAASGAK